MEIVLEKMERGKRQNQKKKLSRGNVRIEWCGDVDREEEGE